MICLTIPGRLPGLNEYIHAERRNRYQAAKMKRDTESRILWAAKKQLRGVEFQRPVILHYTWVEPNRKRDKDNIVFAKKFVHDALVRAGVLRDDGWNCVENFTNVFAVDKRNPRVEVRFEEVLICV